MRSRFIADLLVHSQLFMALSGACFVSAVSLLLVGAVPSSGMLLASVTGILAIHLFDSARGADREDMISQPRRAKLYRSWRMPALLSSVILLVVTGVTLLLVGARAWVLVCFGILGMLALSYVLPVLAFFSRPSHAPVSLKDLARLKPVSISLAWFFGGVLVAVAQPSPGEGLPGSRAFFGLVLMGLPLLLLDSIWLDRRDRFADEFYNRRTFAVRSSSTSFRTACVLLFMLPLAALPFGVAGFEGFILGGMCGAFPLIVLDPERIRSESLRVVLAGSWRITSLLGLLVFPG